MRFARTRSHIVKILSGSGRGNIRKRNKLQQRLRSRTDRRRVDRVQHSVELILLAGYRIENLGRSSVVIGSPGKIAIALGECRYRGEKIKWRTAARSIPSNKVEPFCAAI